MGLVCTRFSACETVNHSSLITYHNYGNIYESKNEENIDMINLYVVVVVVVNTIIIVTFLG